MAMVDKNFIVVQAWPALVTLLIGGILILFRRYSKLSDVPGPALAAFTRLWHIRHIVIGDQNLQLVELHKRHGHFVRLAHNEVSVNHPDGIKKILLAPLRKAPWYEAMRFPDWRWENPFTILDPQKKIALSKNFAPAYTLSNILKSESQVDDIIAKLCDWMDIYAGEKKPMNLDSFFSYTSFDIIGELDFSKQFGFIESGTDVGDSIRNVTALNAYAACAGYLRWFNYLLANPLVTWTKLMPYGHLYDTTVKALGERQKNPDARFDMVAHWFRAHQKHPDRLTMRNIEWHAFVAVGAASDTVSTGLQSFVYHIIPSPQGNHWQRIRTEINHARSEGRCQDRVISFADAQKLLHLQACIKEALRIFSPAPMGLSRVVPPGGLTIGDKTFAPETIVSVSAWVMHHSAEIWGPDVEEFKPERWLGDDAADLEKYFMPWGQGYASCPGQAIARFELSKIAATIVRDYDIRQVDPNQQWHWKARFAMLPHGWPVYIKKVKTAEH